MKNLSSRLNKKGGINESGATKRFETLIISILTNQFQNAWESFSKKYLGSTPIQNDVELLITFVDQFLGEAVQNADTMFSRYFSGYDFHMYQNPGDGSDEILVGNTQYKKLYVIRFNKPWEGHGPGLSYDPTNLHGYRSIEHKYGLTNEDFKLMDISDLYGQYFDENGQYLD